MTNDRSHFEMTLRLEQVVYEASNILRYVLVDPGGSSLEKPEAGCHIDVILDNNIVRQYSLCGDPADASCYEIAVLREENGRGGSKSIHETFHVGASVNVSTPRNHFPLAEDATRHLMLAGGIGVTPMIAMLHELERKGATYELHYCTRSEDVTAFKKTLAPYIKKGSVHIHHDGGDFNKGLDVITLLAVQEPGTHVYYCGPGGFMKAVKDASSHWEKGTVHSEYFSAPADNILDKSENTAFQVKIKDTSEVFNVPADKTIANVLRENGIPVDTQCEDGYCGTCLTRYVEGEPDHRDFVLDEEDREQFMMICCSRAKSQFIVLDM